MSHAHAESDAQAYSIVADLMDVSEAKRTIDEAVEKMGGLDILVSSKPDTKPLHSLLPLPILCKHKVVTFLSLAILHPAG